MKVCVFGLWHLGTVTAACLAAAGHEVVGLDTDSKVIDGLQQGRPPLFEPGLEELVQSGLSSGHLRFSSEPQQALRDVQLVWVTFDTPVDDDDRADVDYVKEQIKSILPHLTPAVLILVSSQLPVCTIASLEPSHPRMAYSPENLRLGKAIQVFMEPDRVVVGTRNEADRQMITDLLSPITQRIEWMSVESAEMTKHALNAFLATSVTFINEIAQICEQVGADAKEVERGLKTEIRIGPRAYLGPGGAFAGGTLARDIMFLQGMGEQYQLPVHLFKAVAISNREHQTWAYRRLAQVIGTLNDKTITLLGLTYKPGTDTLRRSLAIELCHRLLADGTSVRAYDPVVHKLPPGLAESVILCNTAEEALQGADAVIITTEWPDFKQIAAETFVKQMRHPCVLDANRFLVASLGDNPWIRYLTVGKP